MARCNSEENLSVREAVRWSETYKSGALNAHTRASIFTKLFNTNFDLSIDI